MLLLLFLVSCTPSFQHSHYRKRYVPNKWVRKSVPIFKSGTYKNPVIKKEYRRELLQPKIINLNKW